MARIVVQIMMVTGGAGLMFMLVVAGVGFLLLNMPLLIVVTSAVLFISGIWLFAKSKRKLQQVETLETSDNIVARIVRRRLSLW